VEELLRRARPLPPHGEMLIEDLDEAEALAFLAAFIRCVGSRVTARS
jgi:hypothetical protein